MKTRRISRRHKAATLVEVVVSAVVSSLVLFASVTLFLGVIGAWARGESTMDGENDTRQAMRVISDELREAMWVSVDSDGMGITYRKPKKASSGDFEFPITWDGKDRRIYLQGDTLLIESDNTDTRPIADNVLTVDPFMLKSESIDARREDAPVEPGSAPTYKIFEPNSGGVVTEITVMLVTGQRGGTTTEVVRSRKRESIALRNIPEIIK